MLGARELALPVFLVIAGCLGDSQEIVRCNDQDAALERVDLCDLAFDADSAQDRLVAGSIGDGLFSWSDINLSARYATERHDGVCYAILEEARAKDLRENCVVALAGEGPPGQLQPVEGGLIRVGDWMALCVPGTAPYDFRIGLSMDRWDQDGDREIIYDGFGSTSLGQIRVCPKSG